MNTVIEALQAALQSARYAVEATTGRKVVEETLRGFRRGEPAHDYWAVIPQHGGPVASIVLSCQRGLVDRIVDQTFTPQTLRGASQALAERRASTSFQTLAGIFQHRLARAVKWFQPVGTPLISRGPDTLSARAGGERRFGLSVACASGGLDVVITYSQPPVIPPPATDAQRRAHAGEELAPLPYEIVRDARLHRTLDQLVASERDVQLLFPGSSGEPIAASVDGARWIEEARALSVTAPMAPDERGSGRSGDGIAVFFLFAGRLHGLTTRIRTRSERKHEDTVKSTMLLDLPDELIRGQRRRATRVAPSAALGARIAGLDTDCPQVAPRRARPFDCVLSDVSLLGTCVEASLADELFRHGEGSVVVCSMNLPDPWGSAEVPGVVRRFARTMTSDGAFRDLVGVEFFTRPTASRHAESLERVRDYVRSELRRTPLRRAG